MWLVHIPAVAAITTGAIVAKPVAGEAVGHRLEGLGVEPPTARVRVSEPTSASSNPSLVGAVLVTGKVEDPVQTR